MFGNRPCCCYHEVCFILTLIICVDRANIHDKTDLKQPLVDEIFWLNMYKSSFRGDVNFISICVIFKWVALIIFMSIFSDFLVNFAGPC